MMNDTRTDEQFMLDTLCDGDPVVLVNVPRGVIRTLRAEIVQRDEEIARLLNIFHALDAPQKTLVEVTADRDSWERQASDRCDDVLVALDRAERAEARIAALEAEQDALWLVVADVVEMADCVLLDPDGRASIHGSDADLALIQSAIDAARTALKEGKA